MDHMAAGIVNILHDYTCFKLIGKMLLLYEEKQREHF